MENLIKCPWPDWEAAELIGRGSFGTVYEIRRKLIGGEIERAALKVISIPRNPEELEELYGDGYDDESITETFRSHLKSIVSEYSIMNKMDGSDNVVSCKDICYIQHDDGIGWDIFIRMELLTPLIKALPAEVDETTVIRIARDLCRALVLCKKYEIVHRDIKPQNIFMSANGSYKLGDFGIAKTVERTMGGTKIGTYKYMAPEVYNNQPYGSAADIYSLGLVLYWLLNGRRMPFLPPPPAKLKAGMDEEARMRRLMGEPLPVPAYGSKRLKQIVLKACAFEQKDRYVSAAAMLEDLDSLDGNAAAQSVLPVAEENGCQLRDPEHTVIEDATELLAAGRAVDPELTAIEDATELLAAGKAVDPEHTVIEDATELLAAGRAVDPELTAIEDATELLAAGRTVDPELTVIEDATEILRSEENEDRTVYLAPNYSRDAVTERLQAEEDKATEFLAQPIDKNSLTSTPERIAAQKLEEEERARVAAQAAVNNRQWLEFLHDEQRKAKNAKIKQRCRLTVLIAIIIVAVVLSAISTRTGWINSAGDRYYYIKGEKAVGLLTIDNKRYFFDDSGALQFGWQRIDGKTYYFGSDGVMQTGFQKINGSRYYLGRDGVLHTGWLRLNNQTYYCSRSNAGELATGKWTIGGDSYYFGYDGCMAVGAVEITTNTVYYFDNDGRFQYCDSKKTNIATVGSGSQVTFKNRNGGNTYNYYRIFNQPIENCMSMKGTVSLSNTEYGTGNGTWQIHVRTLDGEWKQVGYFDVSDDKGEFDITLDTSISFDAYVCTRYDGGSAWAGSINQNVSEIAYRSYDFGEGVKTE